MLHNSHFRLVAPFACLGILLALVPPVGGQTPVPLFPRNAERLFERAQQFWANVVQSKNSQALEFISPDRKDAYLNRGPSMPILEARIVAIEVTDNRDRAAVRVAVKALDPAGGPISLTLTDTWIWRGNNWYANPAMPKDVWNAFNGNVPDAEVEKAVKEIEANLSGIPSEVDLGTVLQDTHHEFKMPARYAGEGTLRLTLDPRSPLFLMEGSFTKKGTMIAAYLDSGSLDGVFAIPARLRFTSGQAVVEKRITIKGKVFKPLTFRQVADRPSRKGDVFTVFVTNNTAETVAVQSISGEFEADVTKFPTVIEPGQEVEINFKLVQDIPPVRVDVLLKNPVFGRSQYSYLFPKTP